MKLNEIFGRRHKKSGIPVYGLIQIEGRGEWGPEIEKAYIIGPYSTPEEVEQHASKYNGIVSTTSRTPDILMKQCNDNDIPCEYIRNEK